MVCWFAVPLSPICAGGTGMLILEIGEMYRWPGRSKARMMKSSNQDDLEKKKKGRYFVNKSQSKLVCKGLLLGRQLWLELG